MSMIIKMPHRCCVGAARDPLLTSCFPVGTVREFHPLLTAQADRLYLYEFFAPHGAVLSVRVLTDDAGACRGVGFVNYADNASALAAVQARSPALLPVLPCCCKTHGTASWGGGCLLDQCCTRMQSTGCLRRPEACI